VIFRFIDREKADHSVSVMCRVLQVLKEWLLRLAHEETIPQGGGG